MSFFLYILVLCFCNTANAFTVHNTNDFKNLASAMSQVGFTEDIILETDLLLTAGTGFTFAPLGVTTEGICQPFGRRFEGNGHAISIFIQQSSSQPFPHAGLFCGLSGATVQNLIFGQSSVFQGEHAGALTATISGSATIVNVTNIGTVIGNENTGGLVGAVEGVGQETILFEGCANHGDITGSGFNTAGLIGLVAGCTGTTLMVVNSTNSGHIVGSGGGADIASSHVAGLIGVLDGNTEFHLSVNNSSNHGNVHGENKVDGVFGAGLIARIINNNGVDVHVNNFINSGNITCETTNHYCIMGGFFGWVYSNKDSIINLTIQNSENHGNIISESNVIFAFAGGIIGEVSQFNDVWLTMVNVTNSGTIFANSTKPDVRAGGLVGHVYTPDDQKDCTHVVFENCVNHGSVSSSRFACGLMTLSDTSLPSELQVHNCVNTGLVSAGFEACGIVTKVCNASSVASLGSVVCNTSLVYPFWNSTPSEPLLFVNNSFSCHENVCGNATKATCNTKGEYVTVEENERLADLMNHACIAKGQDGVLWSPQLEIVASVHVTLGTPQSCTVVFPKGSELNPTLSALHNITLDSFVVLDAETRSVLPLSFTVQEDTSLILCHVINISGLISKSLFMEHGSLLATVQVLAPFFKKQSVVLDARTKTRVFQNHSVVEDLSLVLARTGVLHIEVELDESAETNSEELKRDIIARIEDNGHTVCDVIVSVKPGDDSNKFYVSLVVVEDQASTVMDLLKSCE